MSTIFYHKNPVAEVEFELTLSSENTLVFLLIHVKVFSGL